jgi:hypothetical protein
MGCFLVRTPRDFGTSLPSKSQEESISSLQQREPAMFSVCAGFAAELPADNSERGIRVANEGR